MNHLDSLWLLKQLGTAFDRADCPELQQYRLSPSEALMLVSMEDLGRDHCYATELHTTLGLSRPAVSSTIKRLRQKGYVEFLEDEFDDRKKKILLEPRAKQALPGLRKTLEGWMRELTRGLDPDELEVFHIALRKLRQNLSEDVRK